MKSIPKKYINFLVSNCNYEIKNERDSLAILVNKNKSQYSNNIRYYYYLLDDDKDNFKLLANHADKVYLNKFYKENKTSLGKIFEKKDEIIWQYNNRVLLYNKASNIYLSYLNTEKDRRESDECYFLFCGPDVQDVIKKSLDFWNPESPQTIYSIKDVAIESIHSVVVSRLKKNITPSEEDLTFEYYNNGQFRSYKPSLDLIRDHHKSIECPGCPACNYFGVTNEQP